MREALAPYPDDLVIVSKVGANHTPRGVQQAGAGADRQHRSPISALRRSPLDAGSDVVHPYPTGRPDDALPGTDDHPSTTAGVR